MAKYTIELKTLVEQKYELNLENYPIFDETYRDTLNNKIINHYYFHEIGFETPDRFNHYLGTTMSEIMPYYNQLYESAKLEIEPLVTDNFTETTTRTGDETTTTNGVNQSQVKSNTENKQVNEVYRNEGKQDVVHPFHYRTQCLVFGFFPGTPGNVFGQKNICQHHKSH